MTTEVALVALALVGYTYLLFPLIVFIRGRLVRRPWRKDERTPTVTLVIVCHNEARHIKAKLQNVVDLDYPFASLEILVASDGSDDGTDEIVERFADERLRLLSYPRRGKIPALNDAVATARGELLVFTDANSHFKEDALRNLVRHFADASIGCVAGNQVYTRRLESGACGLAENLYWSFDRRLKHAESLSGNTISATGAIYAIRRDLFQPAPSGVTDDYAISTRVISQGYRIIFDLEAIAGEPVAEKPRAEFRRKVRVMTRGLRAVWRGRDLLNPFRHGFYSLQLFSHKVLRRLVVLPLLLLIVLIPWLWSEGLFFRALAMAQVAVYGLGIAGFALSGTRIGRWRLLALPYYFCLVNVAALVAVLNVLRGRSIERWESQRADAETPTWRLHAVTSSP